MDHDNQSEPGICTSILTRYSTSPDPNHHHLCSLTADITQTLKDQNQPLTPLSFFLATSTSLQKLLSSDPNPPTHHVNALITIMSLVLASISPAVVRKQAVDVSGLVTRVVMLSGVDDGAVVSGLKCVSGLLVVGFSKSSWSDDVSRLFGVVLGFVADHRLKLTCIFVPMPCMFFSYGFA